MSAAYDAIRHAPEGGERKRAYRYCVTGHGGSGTKAIGDSPFILDWQYLGRSYTWHIYNMTTMEAEGWIAGSYVDTGYIVDGAYKSDAELAA